MKTSLLLFVFLFILVSCKKGDNGPSLKASFEYADGGAGLILFQDKSTNADIYRWDFGDGSISIETDPAYAYTSNGTFKVRLTVSNSSGQDFTEKNVVVTKVKL